MTPDIAIAWLLFNLFLVVVTLVWGIFRFRKGIWYRKLILKFQAYFLWGIGGIALLSSIIPFSYIYTEHLWFFQENFENAGYSDIFWKIRKVKWGLFAAFFFIALAFMNFNAFLANRLCPESREFGRWTHDRTVSFHRTFFCSTVIIALILAVPMMSLHDVFIRYLERPIEKIEPYLLGKDRNFFLFSFPLHQAISLWVNILLWTTCFIVGILYNYYYRRDARSKGYVKRNIVLHGTFLWLMLLLGNIWLINVNLWNKVYTSPITDNLTELHGFFYMDSQLAGSTLVYCGVLLLIGAALLINLFIRKRILWYMAIAVWGLSYITLIHVYPPVNHWWNVKTVELAKEGDYLKSHIQSTRTAFNLNTITVVDYNEEEATLEMVKQNPDVVENIQLWDRHVLFDLLKADHLVRHYNFHRFTDVDRYRVGGLTSQQEQTYDGDTDNTASPVNAEIEESNETDVDTESNEQYRQVLIAAQEIDPDEVEGWRLQKLHFTHGYGVFMSPANDIEDWDPIFWVKGIPYTLMEKASAENNEKEENNSDENVEQSRIYYNEDFPELKVTQPRIYYGEMTYDYVIANTEEPENDLEYKPSTNGTNENDAQTSESIESKYHYEGTGGVLLGGWFRRLCFSIRFKTFRILRNEALQPESRVMYWRKIGTRHGKKMVTDRLSHIAPFLDFDPDPYIVINNGQLWWIVDFYVTSKHYPNAQFYEDDTSPSPDSNYVEPHYKRFKRFNYIRNSGVAVVNAYSGEVSFYAIKDNEVFTNVYKKAHPSLFKGYAEMPIGLQEHLRFPDYLTRIQAKMYGVYHVVTPKEFLSRDDRWHIPTEFYYSDKPDQEMMPYYAMLKLPGETEIEFVNMVPFTPETKEFKMKAWLVSRCDPKHYGERIVYILSDPEAVPGPKQVEVDITNELADKIWADKPKIRGNIQIFPIDGGIFYVEPVYLIPAFESKDGTSTDTVKKRPKLREVFVKANKVASDQSFVEELKEIIVGQKIDESGNGETTTIGENGEEELTLAQQFDVLMKAVNDFGVALKAAENENAEKKPAKAAGTKAAGNAKAAGNKKNNKKNK